MVFTEIFVNYAHNFDKIGPCTLNYVRKFDNSGHFVLLKLNRQYFVMPDLAYRCHVITLAN